MVWSGGMDCDITHAPFGANLFYTFDVSCATSTRERIVKSGGIRYFELLQLVGVTKNYLGYKKLRAGSARSNPNNHQKLLKP